MQDITLNEAKIAMAMMDKHLVGKSGSITYVAGTKTIHVQQSGDAWIILNKVVG